MNNRCRSFRKGSSAFFFHAVFCLSAKGRVLALAVLLTVNCQLSCFSQVFDSIQVSLQKKPHLVGGFSTKSTFISGFRSPIFTAHAGLDFNNHIKMGAGISWLTLGAYDAGKDNTPFYLDKSFMDSSGPHTVHPALQFRYINLFVEYVYYRSGRWQFSIPIEFGLGDSRYKYNFNGENIIEGRHLIFLYEPAVSGQYKILKWFGVGLDVGYRIMVLNNKNIGSKFNSPVYDIKVLIYWGELYTIVFRKRKST